MAVGVDDRRLRLGATRTDPVFSRRKSANVCSFAPPAQLEQLIGDLATDGKRRGGGDPAPEDGQTRLGSRRSGCSVTRCATDIAGRQTGVAEVTRRQR